MQARLWRLEHGAHLRPCPEINEAFVSSATHECSAEEACPMNHLVFDFSKHELVVPRLSILTTLRGLSVPTAVQNLIPENLHARPCVSADDTRTGNISNAK